MELADNAPAVETPEVTPATSETPETAPDTAAAETPVTEPAAPTQPDVSTTKAFSERLNAKQKEWEQEHAAEIRRAAEADRIAKRLGYQSADDMIAAADAQAMAQEAERKGIDPAVYEQMTKAEHEAAEAKEQVQTFAERLASYERRDELVKAAPAFADATKFGKFFKDNQAEILEYANSIKPVGTPQDQLGFATLMIFEQKYEPPDEEKIGKAAVQKYLEDVRKGNAPVEPRGGGVPPTAPVTTGNAMKDAYAASMARLQGVKQ